MKDEQVINLASELIAAQVDNNQLNLEDPAAVFRALDDAMKTAMKVVDSDKD